MTISGISSSSVGVTIQDTSTAATQTVTFNDVTGSADADTITLRNVTGSAAALTVAGVETLTLASSGSLPTHWQP
jgi:hypothetical protein